MSRRTREHARVVRSARDQLVQDLPELGVGLRGVSEHVEQRGEPLLGEAHRAGVDLWTTRPASRSDRTARA
jgi:hypothetical protein